MPALPLLSRSFGRRLFSALFLLLCGSGLLLSRRGIAQGRVFTWGYNFKGQLGDGTDAGRSTPAPVTLFPRAADAEGFVAIAGGLNFTVALKGDGTVWAWGDNYDGQLGNGVTGNESPPVQVKGPEGKGFLTRIVAIAAGRSHAMALRVDGTVWTWGDNGFGQLGVGSKTRSNVPLQVRGYHGDGFLTGIVAVCGGAYTSFALSAEGTAWAWGNRAYYPYEGDLPNTMPIPIPEPGGQGRLTDIAAIGGGFDTGLAVKTNGTVWTWGYNAYGQLGDGTTIDKPLPTPVLNPQGTDLLTGITAIAGGFHTVALKTDGTMLSWGFNRGGQLGHGDTRDTVLPAPVLSGSGTTLFSDVETIATGSYFTMAQKRDGSLWLWGINSSGQLGDGTTTNRNLPAPLRSLTNIVAFNAGVAHTLAIQAVNPVRGYIAVANVKRYDQKIRLTFRPTGGGETLIRETYLPFGGNILLTDVPAGTYDVAIKGANTLQKVVRGVNTTGGVKLGNVTLLPGDANDDNTVNFDDFQVLADAYFTVNGDPFYSADTDFNCDNQVNFDDFLLLAENYFTDGDE